MSGVYVVNVFDVGSGNCTCHVFAGFKAASEKALSLAKISFGDVNDSRIIKTPLEEMNLNGSTWFFVSEEDLLIVVSFVKIHSSFNEPITTIENVIDDVLSYQEPNSSEDNNRLPEFLEPIIPLPAPISIVNTDPIKLHTSLHAEKILNEDGLDIPAGFSISNKPLTNLHLLNYPYQFKSAVNELTENQKWALVIARVKKLPNYLAIVPETAIFNKNESLTLLIRKTSIGLEIRNIECKYLDVLRDSRAKELESDESEF